jgi:hypothetical protein
MGRGFLTSLNGMSFAVQILLALGLGVAFAMVAASLWGSPSRSGWILGISLFGAFILLGFLFVARIIAWATSWLIIKDLRASDRLGELKLSRFSRWFVHVDENLDSLRNI